MSAVPFTSEELWRKATESLDPARTGKRDVVAAVLKIAERKRQLSLKERWRVKGSDGQEIIVRDVVEKIIH